MKPETKEELKVILVMGGVVIAVAIVLFLITYLTFKSQC